MFIQLARILPFSKEIFPSKAEELPKDSVVHGSIGSPEKGVAFIEHKMVDRVLPNSGQTSYI